MRAKDSRSCIAGHAGASLESLGRCACGQGSYKKRLGLSPGSEESSNLVPTEYPPCGSKNKERGCGLKAPVAEASSPTWSRLSESARVMLFPRWIWFREGGRG
jgi:hypothetical protein